MSVIKFAEERAATTTVQRTANGRVRPVDANGNPLPQAKLWLSVGYMAGDNYVSLPLGQAIDTMAPRELRGTNQEFLKLVTAQNKFLEGLQAMIETLQPGDEIALPKLLVKMRRVKGETVIEGENAFEVDLSDVLSGGKITNPANERAEALAEAGE